MTGMTDMGGEELRSRLLAFDRAVALLHPGRSFRLVLLGFARGPGRVEAALCEAEGRAGYPTPGSAERR